MADTSNLTKYLKDVAKAIKKKKGIEGLIPAADFATEIDTINVGPTIKITSTDYLFYKGDRLDNVVELLKLCDNAGRL